jgi:pimeloyl-ACP methyl ester carboxylesterase/DNA-binding CsgD family transcriptional regulator
MRSVHRGRTANVPRTGEAAPFVSSVVVSRCGHTGAVFDVAIRDVPLVGGSVSYHRFGQGSVVLAGPVGAFYSAAGLLANPTVAAFVGSLGQFADCLLMDRRGLGYSDALPTGVEPTLDLQAADLLAVLDHARVRQAVLLAVGFDAQAVLQFAARHPERTAGVIAFSTTPKLVRSDDHPSGVDRGFVDRWLAAMDPSHTGAPMSFTDLLAPSLTGDSAFNRWLFDVGRQSARPDTARRYLQIAADADVRADVTAIQAPVLVMHHQGDEMIRVENAELLARLAPAGQLRVYPLEGHAIYVGDIETKLADIERFATGQAGRTRRRRQRTGWAALTPAQQKVARHVAAGLTNPEIAARLCISVETVKSHVGAALRTTGFRSRTELAAFVAARFGSDAKGAPH